MPEIVALPPETFDGGNERYRFLVDGVPKSVQLKLKGFDRQLASDLDPWVYDLIEIAALVYGADASVSRGSTTDPRMGANWYRRFSIRLPVRDIRRWQRPGVAEALERTLHFLSGDKFTFQFEHVATPFNGTAWFDLRDEALRAVDRVLMFSGGLDSFAGALEELAEHKHRVALVSHFSSPRIVGVQRSLVKGLKGLDGSPNCQHIVAQIQMKDGATRETTHRTRSFLFAVLGFATAHVFGLKRLSFHENGVVSLNLPPVDNVQSTRATRTTHPQTLALFSEFLSRTVGDTFRVDNPYIFRTKADVVETIARLQMADKIAHTSSCADTRNRNKQHPHCGKCSQCIDRRFAVLSRGLEAFDPQEAYEVDLMTGQRQRVEHRELALSYVRNALAFEHVEPVRLIQDFPTVVSAIDHLELEPSAVAKLIAGLLQRHGVGVAEVMRAELRRGVLSSYPVDSLPRLFGDMHRQTYAGLPSVPRPEAPTETRPPIRLVVYEQSGEVAIDGVAKVGARAASQLLALLARNHLDARGRGLDPLDTPCVKPATLTEALGLDGDEALRKRVSRARLHLAKLCASAGLDPEVGRNLIESFPWNGYRLRPDEVEVRVEITAH